MAVIIATVLICWIMIGVSIRKPVQIAANVSPIEAVRFLYEQKNLSHSKRIHKKLNPFILGKMNFSRDKKKTVSIIMSLSIGGLLLLCASTLVLTYSPEALARKYFPNGEYKIYIDSDRKLFDVLSSGNPLSEELRQEILELDGVEDVFVTRRGVGSSFHTPLYSGGGMVDMITQENDFQIEEALLTGTMPTDVHSILAGSFYDEELEVGSTIEITLGGNTSTVTVCGFFDVTAISVGHGHENLMLDGAMLFLSEELFHEMLPDVEKFDYTWDIVSDPDKDISVKIGLEKLINSHTEIALDFFTERVTYFQSVYSVPFHVLQGIALFISLFGVINLINTTLSNQISRKREVSVLRSVGLTQKQLYQMITLEGVSYALLSIFLTILLGTPLAYILHRQTSRMAYGAPTAFQFPFLYIMLYFLLLIMIEFLLSTWTIGKQGKQSLIEQLREIA